MAGALALFLMTVACFATALIEPNDLEPALPESMCWTMAIAAGVFAAGEAMAIIRSRWR